MTGGGFGGSVVALVKPGRFAALRTYLTHSISSTRAGRWVARCSWSPRPEPRWFHAERSLTAACGGFVAGLLQGGEAMHPFSQLKVPEGKVGVHWFGQNSYAFRSPGGQTVMVDPYFPHERPAEKYMHAEAAHGRSHAAGRRGLPDPRSLGSHASRDVGTHPRRVAEVHLRRFEGKRRATGQDGHPEGSLRGRRGRRHARTGGAAGFRRPLRLLQAARG